MNPQRGTPGEQRLSVYAGGYLTRMREALAEVYEAVHQVLGEAVFTELAEQYAAQQPSHDYNLSLAGRSLPAFLRTWPRTQALPFLPDLAELEWRVCEAFHAFDQPPMDVRHLAARSPEAWQRARIVFQPSVAVVASAWPILDIWAARTQPPADVNIDLVNRPHQVFVFRRELQVRCELLKAPQAALLEALLRGESLGDACERLATEETDPSRLTGWFAHWVSGGLIIRLEFSEADNVRLASTN